ncbi:MAG TPA: hypothetical protein VFQ19_05845 [Nocardioidaceae bacterium]|nr:hypothetical protein [Nocardioidaceae bacterium]
MADIEVDVAVLGWGKGGSCTNINCVRTKALIHQAAARPDRAAAVLEEQGVEVLPSTAVTAVRDESRVDEAGIKVDASVVSEIAVMPRPKIVRKTRGLTHPSTTEAFNEVLAGLRRTT